MGAKNFIISINKELITLVEAFKDADLHGLAQTVSKEQGFLPALVNHEGEGEFVGIDNDKSIIVYHKNSMLQSAMKNRTGVGDSRGDIVNTYYCAMVVYINRAKAHLLPDELFLYIQANFPETLKVLPYKDIVLRIQNVVLNSQAVLVQEYGDAESSVSLGPEDSLMAINYTIEATFERKCFKKCPENC